MAGRAARDFLGLRRTPKGEPPAVPEGHRVYAIGDVHGRSDLLEELLALIKAECAGSTDTVHLVLLGDYVDRGPDSKGVIDRLLNLNMPVEAHVLRGNHEQAVLDFLADPAFYDRWGDYGADDTLTSYGVRPPRDYLRPTLLEVRDRFARAIPPNHLSFFETLPLSWEFGDYFFAHAGVRPGVPLAEQEADDLLWIRWEFLRSTENFGKVVVHGHTPAANPEKTSNRIGVDTGAYITGRLTAVVLTGTEQRFIQTGSD